MSFDSDEEPQEKQIAIFKRFKLNNEENQNNNLIANSIKSKSFDRDVEDMSVKFGKFKLFGQTYTKNNRIYFISSKEFFDDIENYVINNYGDHQLLDLMHHFHLFLDKNLLSWYFENYESHNNNYLAFKNSFIDFINQLEFEYYQITTLNTFQFNNELKSNKSLPTTNLINADESPLSFYLINKFNLLKIVYPNVAQRDLFLMVISHLNFNTFTKFKELENNPESIKFKAKLIDQKKECFQTEKEKAYESLIIDHLNYLEFKQDYDNLIKKKEELLDEKKLMNKELLLLKDFKSKYDDAVDKLNTEKELSTQFKTANVQLLKLNERLETKITELDSKVKELKKRNAELIAENK